MQPLPPEVVAALRDYLQGKPSGAPVWPGTWSDHSADMVKVDLADAQIPYVVEGPNGPLFFDFHSTRHSFITMLERVALACGVSLKLRAEKKPEFDREVALV